MRLQEAQDRIGFGPARAELFDLLGAPVGKHFFGEIGSGVQKGAAEVEDVGTFNYGHVNRQQIVIPTQQLRDLATADFVDVEFLQSKINISFPKVGGLLVMKLERRQVKFGLAVDSENDTMYPKSKLFAERQTSLGCI